MAVSLATNPQQLSRHAYEPSVRRISTSFSPDGNFLAVGWYDGAVDLWDVPARRRIRALTDGGELPPGRVAFSPARNLLAATSDTKV